ncbi:hypothetical protein WR25_20133 isoform C [Diploscapter pachys]|nr:hypothetical protein WR25_20133 isoform C [Diploscapter pachys]
MGQMFMYDWVNGHTSVEDFDKFSMDDVDLAFKRVQSVKYNQTILLKGDSGIQFTPLPAGHMIGGAIWKISRAGEDDIVYAVDFNHKKERHLNGCVFDNTIRPHLLITDAYNAMYSQKKRYERDQQLVTSMLTTVRDGGNCLIVIDTAGRVLEIAHLLEQLWSNEEAGLTRYNLVLLSYVASSVVEFAKSQVEWMSDKIMKAFQQSQVNPFNFRYMKLCHSQQELAKVRSPKIVLCSNLDMESGFSRELFLEWCSDRKNTVIITGRSEDRTLGSKLIHIANETAEGRKPRKEISLEVKRRIRIEGAELEAYRRMKAEKEAETARLRLETSRRNARLEMAGDDSDDESDDDETLANAVAVVTGMKSKENVNQPSQNQASQVNGNQENQVQPALELNTHDIMLKWEHQQKSSFFKANKKIYPMFPYVEEKMKWDDYGEIIRPNEYKTEDTIAQIETVEYKRESTDDGEQIMIVEEKVPTKCVRYVQKMEILCKVEFIDFEGRCDGESIKKLLEKTVQPRQIIIVHGTSEATRHLATYIKEKGIVQGRIFTPLVYDIVDATVESHIYQVSLSDALMSTLYFQPVGEAELAWIDAKVMKKAMIGDRRGIDGEKEDEENSSEKESNDVEMQDENETEEERRKRLKKRKQQKALVLDVLPSTNIPSHKAVFVNDPKLSELKQIMQNLGHSAEFSGGVLYINGIISIRRLQQGQFHVEGCASKLYYEIRDYIYQQFAII